MTMRWVAGALAEAKNRFRKLRGHRDRKTLLVALDTHAAQVDTAERKVA